MKLNLIFSVLLISFFASDVKAANSKETEIGKLKARILVDDSASSSKELKYSQGIYFIYRSDEFEPNVFCPYIDLAELKTLQADVGYFCFDFAEGRTLKNFVETYLSDPDVEIHFQERYLNMMLWRTSGWGLSYLTSKNVWISKAGKPIGNAESLGLK